MKEYEYYQNVKNWDFSKIKDCKETLTNWDMYEILRNNTNKESKILDLGTAGGEQIMKHFPDVKEILATDYSEEMINTAKKNLLKSNKKNVVFEVMDNLNMTTKDNYYDVVTARHTPTDPKQIFKTLKNGGLLIIRGVDQLDCWSLKRMFNKGQGYKDTRTIALRDYEAVLDAGFKDVELVPIHTKEYYETKEDLLKLLYKVPILLDCSEDNPDSFDSNPEIDMNILDEYIKNNTYEKGILLIRRYYGITAKKPM
jgi:protein-L-isoaspartate O-methyltransferase